MYFCMYGMTIDSVVINKIMPQDDLYFREWSHTQQDYVQSIISYFDPVPVSKLPMFPREVCGIEDLGAFAGALHGEDDATRIFVDLPPYGFKKTSEDEYRLEIPMRFAPKEEINVLRKEDDLVVRIGTFKRNILLPRAIHAMETAGASMEGDRLVIRFKKPAAMSGQ